LGKDRIGPHLGVDEDHGNGAHEKRGDGQDQGNGQIHHALCHLVRS